jgi:hypothetical protein
MGNGGMTIIVFLVVGAIAGVLLGTRFKVFALAPATLLAAAVIIASGHQSKVAMALTVLATTVLLHIGYALAVLFGSWRRHSRKDGRR